MSDKANPTMPIIHLNGTSAKSLLRDNLEARAAIEDSIRRIQRMEFNGRDYYPVTGSFEKARAERDEIINKLRECSAYFMAVAEHCASLR